MLTRRVGGSGVSSIQAAALIPRAAELLIEKPPPRTPNLPATAGSAMTAAAALPPLRLRSSPQPQRMTRRRSDGVERGEALEIGGVDFARSRRASIVHSSARARRPSTPRACSPRNAVAASPRSNRYL